MQVNSILMAQVEMRKDNYGGTVSRWRYSRQ
jgi:hypothetical protein